MHCVFFMCVYNYLTYVGIQVRGISGEKQGIWRKGGLAVFLQVLKVGLAIGSKLYSVNICFVPDTIKLSM